jgi:broad specificity polyphosphatase/5'/3'-nucleotidase SurE
VNGLPILHLAKTSTDALLAPFYSVYSLSGTCGAAFAGVTLGIPSIATSAFNFTHRSYKDIDYNNPYDSSLLAANLVANLVSSLADGYDKSSGKPLFPLGIGLNVNLPELSQNCSAPEFHLTRESSVEIWTSKPANLLRS